MTSLNMTHYDFQLRQCQEKLEEVELTNEHLEKRLEKIRAARQKS